MENAENPVVMEHTQHIKQDVVIVINVMIAILVINLHVQMELGCLVVLMGARMVVETVVQILPAQMRLVILVMAVKAVTLATVAMEHVMGAIVVLDVRLVWNVKLVLDANLVIQNAMKKNLAMIEIVKNGIQKVVL